MEKKNPVDKIGWYANSLSMERNGPASTNNQTINVELTGRLLDHSICIDFGELERGINNRMNNNEGEKEKMSCRFEKEFKELSKNTRYGTNPNLPRMVLRYMNAIPEIKDVIFNPPATIVFWTDGTKTVVKCQNNEEFDPEKGLSMAYFKKAHGNIGHYFEEIKKWCEKHNLSIIKDEMHEMADEKIIEAVKKDTSDPKPRWHIWYRTGASWVINYYEKDYSSKSSAVRRARKLFANTSEPISWTVSTFCPESDDAEWHCN